MAVLTSVSLWLLGVEYALLIGIISGVVEILPIIGPWSAAGFAHYHGRLSTAITDQ
jgi:predicted PurR-regulated permease PerM